MLDALHGLALLGVLLINAQWFMGDGNAVSERQFDSLPTSHIDRGVGDALDLFVYAKAIGVFAFLFGVSPEIGHRPPYVRREQLPQASL